jgi:hypothetical protein
VKLDKLTRRLSRDLAANPKKAGILGVMVLVALYFWFPMIAGWFKSQGTNQVAAATDVILTDDPIAPEEMTARPKESLRWEKVRQWLEADRLTTSAAIDPSWRDPFAPTLKETKPEEPTTSIPPAEAAALAAQAEEIDPESAGVKIASVMIGRRKSAVVIDGDVYRENDVVSVTSKEGTTLDFRLTSIQRELVEFERNGKRYKIALSRPRLAKGDVIAPQAD